MFDPHEMYCGGEGWGISRGCTHWLMGYLAKKHGKTMGKWGLMVINGD
jgi:hypothetical protein